MNQFYNRFKNISLLSLGLLLAASTTIAATVLMSPSAPMNERARLDKNCATAVIPAEAEIHTVYNPESTTIVVNWAVGEQENNVDLPITPAKNCRTRNKEILQQARADYEAQVRDTCNDFRGMLAETVPLPEKNGQQGNLAAASEYIRKHCQ